MGVSIGGRVREVIVSEQHTLTRKFSIIVR